MSTAQQNIENYFKVKEQLDARKAQEIKDEKQKVADEPVSYVKSYVKKTDNLLEVREVTEVLEVTEAYQNDIIKQTQASIFTVEFAAKNNIKAREKLADIKEAAAILKDATAGVALTTFNEGLNKAMSQFAKDKAALEADKIEIEGNDIV